MNKLTKALDTAKELNSSLINHPLVIEYKKYASIIKSNSYYKDLDLKLRNMQKEIISNYNEDLVNEYTKDIKDKVIDFEIIERIIKLLELTKTDACVVKSAENRRYLTGLATSAGMVVITEKGNHSSQF